MSRLALFARRVPAPAGCEPLCCLTFLKTRFPFPLLTHGRCIDHSWTVAAHYARHGLSFDVFTWIPVSWMEIADWQTCQRATAKVDFDGETGGMEKLPGPTLRMIRFMKPFRWFKIARILKMSRMRAWTRTRRTEWCAFTRCVFTL